MLQALQVSQPMGWALVTGNCPMLNVDTQTMQQVKGLVGKDVAVYGGRFDAEDNALLESQKVNTPASLAESVDKVMGIISIKEILKTSQSRWFKGTYGVTFKNPRMYPTPVDLFDDPEDSVVFDWETPPVVSIPPEAVPVLCGVCRTAIYHHDGQALSPAGFLHSVVCEDIKKKAANKSRHRSKEYLIKLLDEYIDATKSEVIQEITKAIAELRIIKESPEYFKGYSNSFQLTGSSSRELLLAHLVTIKGFTYMGSLDINHWSVLEMSAELVAQQTGVKVKYDPQEAVMIEYLKREKEAKAAAAQRLAEKRAAQR